MIKNILRELFSFAITFIIVFVAIKGIYTYVAEPFEVDGSSMEYSLHDGEKMFMYKLAEPDRFDVVIFPTPLHYDDEEETDDEKKKDDEKETKLYVKRVIGVEGDHVAYKDGQLYLNGHPLDEPYLAEMEAERGGKVTNDFTLESLTGEATVPEGKLFVLGDNRQNSLDGRRFGFIDVEDVIGEAVFAWWPISQIRRLPNYVLSPDGTQIITD